MCGGNCADEFSHVNKFSFSIRSGQSLKAVLLIFVIGITGATSMGTIPFSLACYSALVGVILLTVWTHIMHLCCSNRMRKLPPGPPGWPIVGHLFLLGKNPHQSLFHLAQKYGPLMTLRLGRKTTVVVSSPAMAKELLKTNDHVSAFRNVPQALRCHSFHESSMIWAQYGPRWRMLRRLFNTEFFSARRLNALQHLRRDQIFRMIGEIHDDHLKELAVNIGQAAFLTTFNLLGNMIFAQNMFLPHSPASKEMRETIWKTMETVATPNLADFFPLLRFVDPQGIRRKTGTYLQLGFDLFDKMIEDRIVSSETRDDATQAINFLDILLGFRINNAVGEGESPKFTRVDINWMLFEIFAAGTDTTSTTVEWALAELIKNPRAMKRAQAETEEVVGRQRRVEESDIQHLPYLQAVVKEVFRLHPPAPLLLPHRAGASFQVGGFHIPKDTELIVNVWGMGRDPSVWNEPLEFVPERFVQSEMDYKGNDFELIPFGAGRRICSGLPLANRMVQWMLASLVHSFDWSLPDGQSIQQMDMTEKFGVTLPKAVPLIVIARSRLPVALLTAP